jgi:hypothetical protein
VSTLATRLSGRNSLIYFGIHCWHKHCNTGLTQKDRRVKPMKCEVVGWLFVDAEKPQLLVREHSDASPQCVNLDTGFEHQAIQTGAFRRGNPIIDPVTQQTVGYEMETLLAHFPV